MSPKPSAASRAIRRAKRLRISVPWRCGEQIEMGGGGRPSSAACNRKRKPSPRGAANARGPESLAANQANPLSRAISGTSRRSKSASPL